MPYLLLGPDDFSKHDFVKQLQQKLNAEVQFFYAGDTLPTLEQLSQSDLFAKAKIFVFVSILPEYLIQISNSEKAKNRVAVLLDSLDKRKKENKELLTQENIEVKEFLLPHGKDLDSWIIKRVKDLGGSISTSAANELAMRLGRDNAKEVKAGGKVISTEEIYNLFTVENEIKKLLALADGQEISESMVKELVSENGEVEVFDLTNAIGDGQKEKSIFLMQKFLGLQTGTDEKGSVIQLNALLAEQFRNVAMVQNFILEKVSEDDILEKTGWKSGRLFIMKKMAGKFNQKKITETLVKLEALDQELKTTQTPPKVLLDLIISQLF